MKKVSVSLVLLCMGILIFGFASGLKAQEGMSTNPKARTQTAPQSQTEPESWKDPDTHLVWTRKDNGSPISFSAAEAYCQALPHAGHPAWKLPDIQQIGALMDSNQPQHMKGGFYSGPATRFWGGPVNAIADFGRNTQFNLPPDSVDVRERAICVYDANIATASTWTDRNTSLMWSRSSMGTVELWQASDSYCKSLVLGGLSEWRLPTIDELATLYDPSQQDTRHLRSGMFAQNSLWSSTSASNSEKLAFDFESGKTMRARIAKDAPIQPLYTLDAVCVRVAR
jgi:hypothetical protein